MFILLGQPGYSILSRSGKYLHWYYLYNDNIKKKQIKYDYHLSIKFSIYFFFKYSIILFKNHWFNYSKLFNSYNSISLKIFKKTYYIDMKWKYKISHFTLLTKSFYLFEKFKPVIIDSDIYVIHIKNYIFIYWFWGTIISKQKKKKKKTKKKKFI